MVDWLSHTNISFTSIYRQRKTRPHFIQLVCVCYLWMYSLKFLFIRTSFFFEVSSGKFSGSFENWWFYGVPFHIALSISILQWLSHLIPIFKYLWKSLYPPLWSIISVENNTYSVFCLFFLKIMWKKTIHVELQFAAAVRETIHLTKKLWEHKLLGIFFTLILYLIFYRRLTDSWPLRWALTVTIIFNYYFFKKRKIYWVIDFIILHINDTKN